MRQSILKVGIDPGYLASQLEAGLVRVVVDDRSLFPEGQVTVSFGQVGFPVQLSAKLCVAPLVGTLGQLDNRLIGLQARSRLPVDLLPLLTKGGNLLRGLRLQPIPKII